MQTENTSDCPNGQQLFLPEAASTTQSQAKNAAELRPNHNSHYVYLLVSKKCSGFKLGFIRAWTFHFRALRRGYDEFDEEGSFIVQVSSRRSARELEEALRAHYKDAVWRVTAPTPVSLGECSDVGEYTEWYAIRAFAPMLATLVGLLHKSRLARRSIVSNSLSGPSPRGMSLAEALSQTGRQPQTSRTSLSPPTENGGGRNNPSLTALP